MYSEGSLSLGLVQPIVFSARKGPPLSRFSMPRHVHDEKIQDFTMIEVWINSLPCSEPLNDSKPTCLATLAHLGSPGAEKTDLRYAPNERGWPRTRDGRFKLMTDYHVKYMGPCCAYVATPIVQLGRWAKRMVDESTRLAIRACREAWPRF